MDPTLAGFITNTTPNEEIIIPTEDAIAVKLTPDEFSEAVDEQIKRASKDAGKLKLSDRQKLNLKYYLGDQVDKSQVRGDLEKGVENALLRNIETLIPIATSRTPELTTTAAYKNQSIRDYALNVRRVMQAEWEVYQGMQQQISRGIRNHQVNLLAVFQVGYDPETDEFWTEEIVATDLVISKNGDFVARYIKDKTIGDLLRLFPDKEAEIQKELGLGVSGKVPTVAYASPVTYIEAWTNEVVGWKLKKLVLGVENNPHFDYTGQKVNALLANQPSAPQMDPQSGQMVPVQPQTVAATVKYNHLKKPKHPFLFLHHLTRGVHIYDDTTLLEQGIGLQDWINKRKRQIGMNADSTNGHWVTSGDFISREEFDKIQGGIDEKIWLETGLPADGIVKHQGQPLPDYIYSDLQDSRQALDNLMGTHSTTRGEASGSNTLGQDMIAKDQDYGRVDGYVRDGIERLAQEWYEYMYHMYLVYRTDKKAIAIPDDSDFETDNVSFSRSSIPLIRHNDNTVTPVPMLLRVKQGSTLPDDEMAEYQKAQNALSAGVIAPIDYYKMTGEPNPRELAKNLLMWQNDPFSFFANDPDIQAMQQKMAQQAQMQQQQQMQMEQAKAGNGQAAPTGNTTPGEAPPQAAAASSQGQQSAPTTMGVAKALHSMLSGGGTPGGGGLPN